MTNEAWVSQRSPDEVEVRIAATVDTADAAMTWIVRQVDRRGLRDVSFGCSPIWVFNSEGDGDGDRCFEVWASGKPKESA